MQAQPTFKKEFIVLMASMMSIVALSIDAVLPALPNIGTSLNITDPAETQKIITMIFLGLGFGQLIFGPLSDSFGRKPMVYIGFSIFVIASYICVTTKSFEMMILGRVLQGIGLSSPRTIAVTMIRDSYSGDYMAKILSTIVMFFIIVPIIAPTMGQAILKHFNWEAIFNFNVFLGLIIIVWFWHRQPETLAKKHRIKFSPSLFITGTKEFFKHKESVAFTLTAGLITGSFMVYLSTSQQIFQEQYNMGDLFPYIFGSTAFAIGFSTFINSRIVLRFGASNIAYWATIAYFGVSLLYVVLFSSGENPSLPILVGFFIVQFFCIGFLFGNYKSLAMLPLGHVAGIGASINGFVATVLAVPIANYIGGFVTTSVLPLFIGFSVFGGLSLVVFVVLKRGRS